MSVADLLRSLISHECLSAGPGEQKHQIVGLPSRVHWSLDLILMGDSIYFEQGSLMHVTYLRVEQHALVILLAYLL